MVFTENQKNIIIELAERYVVDLQRTLDKISTRNDQFIASYGNKTGSMEEDMTKLTLGEIKTKKVVLSKLRAQIMHIDSSILFEMQKVDKEIARRP